MLNRTAVVVLGILFFCGNIVSAPRLPKFSSYPDLITSKYGKLTSAWAQEAIGVYEGHAFLKEVGAEISSAVPRIGVMDVGFDIAALLNNTRLSSGLREQLTSPPTDLLSVIQNPEKFFDQLSPNNLHGNTQAIFYLTMASVTDESDKINGSIEHGTAVTHLLASESPFSVSMRGEVDFLFLLVKERKAWQSTQRLSSIAAQEVLPDILNLSASFGVVERVFTPTELLAPFRELARRTLVVTGAGNEFPDPIESVKRELLGEIIIVGSSDPSGDASWFSAAGDKVTICAPSDVHLQTIGSDGCISFSGTSGATPLVTGALADVLSILPSLTVSEAIHMLRKTAVIGAVLSLNYYKLMRVTAKLANQRLA